MTVADCARMISETSKKKKEYDWVTTKIIGEKDDSDF